MKPRHWRAPIALVALLVCTAAAAQEQSAAADNGTDPTRFTTVAEAKFEYLDLDGGFSSETLRLSYTQPFADGRWNFRARLPVSAVDVAGDNGYDVGDFSLEVAHVFGLSRTGAFVAKGELVFDTSARPDLGTGHTVFKGTLIYARFLPGGNILAPAVVHSIGFAGDDGRADVNATTLDFYYVPRLRDPRNLITYDPALNFDWENDTAYASLAITFGRVLGPRWGGKSIFFIKPTVFGGNERPGDWGLEIGYKIIAF